MGLFPALHPRHRQTVLDIEGTMNERAAWMANHWFSLNKMGLDHDLHAFV